MIFIIYTKEHWDADINVFLYTQQEQQEQKEQQQL